MAHAGENRTGKYQGWEALISALSSPLVFNIFTRPTDGMAVPPQSVQGRRQVLLLHQQVISVERRDDEDAYSGFGQGCRQRFKDADHGERNDSGNPQTEPVPLALTPSGTASWRQTTDSSSAVRVIEKNWPAVAQGGMGNRRLACKWRRCRPSRAESVDERPLQVPCS